jgi:hypothetical protein
MHACCCWIRVVDYEHTVFVGWQSHNSQAPVRRQTTANFYPEGARPARPRHRSYGCRWGLPRCCSVIGSLRNYEKRGTSSDRDGLGSPCCGGDVVDTSDWARIRKEVELGTLVARGAKPEGVGLAWRNSVAHGLGDCCGRSSSSVARMRHMVIPRAATRSRLPPAIVDRVGSPDRLVVRRGFSKGGSAAPDFGDDVVGVLGPDERLRVVVPV